MKKEVAELESEVDELSKNIEDQTSSKIEPNNNIEQIPEGYKTKSQRHNLFSQYLILEKDNQLFSYETETKKINKIDIDEPNSEYEIFPSISEPNQFYIIKIINLKNTDMLEYTFDEKREYFYDAATNTLKVANEIKYMDDYVKMWTSVYDSKYSRFFHWIMGGPVSMLPLMTYNTLSKEEEIILNYNDLQLTETPPIQIEYIDGEFRIMHQEKTIAIIKPTRDVEVQLIK